MTTPQFFSASQLSVYAGDIGATADEFVAATGALVIDPGSMGYRWARAVQQRRYLGGPRGTDVPDVPGLARAGRRGPDHPAGLHDDGARTSTPLRSCSTCAGAAASPPRRLGAAQVGIHRLSLNRPLKKPSHGVQILIDSPFNVEVNGVQAKALVYLPKARLSCVDHRHGRGPGGVGGRADHSAAEPRFRGVHRLPVR